jgi:DMSO reductase anchor subunit
MEDNPAIIQNIVKYITKLTIIGLVIIFIITEFISLSNFAYSYNFSYNYGNKLRDSCNNKNFEYETGRYQLYKKIINNILLNDTYNITNYTIILSIILTIAIIFGLLVAYILFTFIYDISNNDENNTMQFKLLCYGLILLLCGYCVIYMPLYIGYNFDKKNSNKLENFNSSIYTSEIIFSVIFAIMLLIYFASYIKTAKYNYTSIFVLTMGVFFYLCINLIKSFIKFYKSKNIKLEFKNSNIKNYDDKVKDFLRNEIDIETNIINDYLLNLLNIDFKNIDLNYYTSIAIITIIIVIILLIVNRAKNLKNYYDGSINFKELVNCLLYFNNNCENLLYNNNETNIIYNFVILPLIYIGLITLIINATINYNSKINKNILLNPLIIYKNKLNEVNNNFNNILNNDRISFKEKKSVERNVANTILLVLYNELFSNYLVLSETEKLGYEEFTIQNIVPKFNYNFNNKTEILNYQEIDEYKILNYIENKCSGDIFKSKNLNSQCNENNRVLIYYILKDIFLYKPIANIPLNDKNNLDSYDHYSNILKYKIYTGLLNYKKERNYLGITKLENNDYEKNCRLDIKFTEPEITKEELLLSLGQKLTAELRDYKDSFTQRINPKKSKDEIFNSIRNIILEEIPDEDMIASTKQTIINSIKEVTPNILQNRIFALETNKIISTYKDTIDLVIKEYISYIINIKKSYFAVYKAGEQVCVDNEETGEKDCTITLDIIDSDLINKFKNGNGINNENTVSFIRKYKETIKLHFNEINNILSNFETRNDYSETDKMKNYILENYNMVNSEKLLNNDIVLHNKTIQNPLVNKNIEDLSESELEQYNNMNLIVKHILIYLYYNNYFITKINDLYSNAYLKSILKQTQSLYDSSIDSKNLKELKQDYANDLNKLMIILNFSINNIKINENQITMINEYIKDSEINKYIIDNIVLINSEYNNELDNLNKIIDDIKKTDYIADTNNIVLTLQTNINDEFLFGFKGLKRKLEVYYNYKNIITIDAVDLIDQNIELINNIFVNQLEILNKTKNEDLTKLNFNELIINLKYVDIFNNSIEEYIKHNIKTIKEPEQDSQKQIISENYINKDKSEMVFNNANITSQMIFLLLTIYIISLFILIKLK